MSKVKELVEQLCPDGVEYRTLGEVIVCYDSKRKPVTRKNRVAGPYPYYGAAGIQDYVSDYILEGEFVLLGEDGTVVQPNGRPIVTWAEGRIWVNNHAHVLTGSDIADTRYLYFVLQTVDVRAIVRGLPPKLNQANMRGITIPVPPIEVQREVVRILDSFQELDDALTAEIEARERQLDAYRDELLGSWLDRLCLEGVERRTLGDVATVMSGYPFKSADYSDFGVRVIRISDVQRGYISDKDVKYVSATKTPEWKSVELFENDILVSLTGDVGKVARVDKSCLPAALNQRVACIRADERVVEQGYLFHITSRSGFESELMSASSGVAQKNLSMKGLRSYSVLVPPIDVQQDIVATLDTMQSLIDALRSERDARRRQFAYYRDKLLAFPERG